MSPVQRVLVTFAAVAIASWPAVSPVSAATAQPLFESVSRGYFTFEDGSTVPRKVTLEQLVISDVFADVNSVVIATGCEVMTDDGDAGGEGAAAIDQLGKVIATVRLFRADGSQVKLGKVRSRPEGESEVFGFKLVNLPGGLERGDRLAWTLKLKRFPQIPAEREIELMAGIAHPALLED